MTPSHPSSAQIVVVKPGWLTTIQDLGRHAYQRFGMPVSGAMDGRSCVIANRLVGNHDQDAALEITLRGPELSFRHDTVIAITGAHLTPVLDGIEVPLWTSLLARAGSRLTFGARRAGARCYLAVAGGIEVPKVLGSRSTHVSSRTGGMQGRALEAGDTLSAGVPSAGAAIGRALPDRLRPVYSPVATLRILPGPTYEGFEEGALEILTSHPYRLASQSDRMGYRLEGAALPCAGADRYISDGTAMGALQVTPDGQPILLMADRQTTGGYPTIAVVISADWHVSGQLMPGETIVFKIATLSEAEVLLTSERHAVDEGLPSPYE